jgi:hypothetical protein
MRKAIIGISLAGLLVVGLFFGLAVRNNQKEAELFLQKSKELKVGSSTYEEAKSFLNSNDKHLQYSRPCSANDCEVVFEFRNSWMRALRLAPGTSFGGRLIFRDGVLALRYMHLGQGVCCVNIVTEGRELEPGALEDQLSKDFSKSLQRDESGQPWHAYVLLSPKATPEQRQEAYSFDLSCLSKLGGCKNAAELAPGVWRN